MVRHRKPRTPVRWDRVKSAVRTAAPWVELFVTVIGLIMVVTGKG
ncbi:MULTISPECIES: hypothetical protein [Streptomyces]|nr:MULTISPECIES: hypothetical protein [Streptomyces]